jgi:hypothetical protein
MTIIIFEKIKLEERRFDLIENRMKNKLCKVMDEFVLQIELDRDFLPVMIHQ